MSITNWINFFGIIISGLIAGLFAYLGVKLTLDRQEKSRDIQSIENSFEKLYYPLQDVLKKIYHVIL